MDERYLLLQARGEAEAGVAEYNKIITIEKMNLEFLWSLLKEREIS